MSMVKSNTDRSQVGEICTPRRCRMGVIHVGHFDAKSSEQIHQARRYQVKVGVANQREHRLKTKYTSFWQVLTLTKVFRTHSFKSQFLEVYVLYLRKYDLHEHERSTDTGTICRKLFKLASNSSGSLDRSTSEQ